MAEAQAFMMEKMKLVEEKSKEKMKIEAEKAKVEATESHVKNEAFIAKLKTDNKNVKETPEGLVYEVISEGKGPKPTDKDLVTVNYRGTLIDGTEFDSSYKTKTPATFVSGEVIEGFRKGIQLVSKGGKVKLFLRPTLAYGDQFRIPGVPNAKAGALLIFEIELVDFKAPPAAATPIVVPPTAAAAPVVSEAAAAARTPPAPESKAPQGVPPANK
jgi:FKBP-type peptidyl-prolyl cis-trans isomerase